MFSVLVLFYLLFQQNFSRTFTVIVSFFLDCFSSLHQENGKQSDLSVDYCFGLNFCVSLIYEFKGDTKINLQCDGIRRKHLGVIRS